jgi:hypothetical protein
MREQRCLLMSPEKMWISSVVSSRDPVGSTVFSSRSGLLILLSWAVLGGWSCHLEYSRARKGDMSLKVSVRVQKLTPQSLNGMRQIDSTVDVEKWKFDRLHWPVMYCLGTTLTLSALGQVAISESQSGCATNARLLDSNGTGEACTYMCLINDSYGRCCEVA